MICPECKKDKQISRQGVCHDCRYQIEHETMQLEKTLNDAYESLDSRAIFACEKGLKLLRSKI